MQQKEMLSAYMDGDKTVDHFAEKLCRCPELQQKWANYHQIGCVMRGEHLLGQDFSAKMAGLIEQEPSFVAKQDEQPTAKPRGLLIKLKGWTMPLMQMGIAASVCLVAVLGVKTFNGQSEMAQTEPVQNLQTLPFSTSVQPVSYNAPQTQPNSEQLEYQQRRMDALLQNHELQRRTQVGEVTPSAEEKAKSQTSQSQK